MSLQKTFFALLMILPTTAFSTAYIDATDEFPYTKIHGDGTEAGVVAEISFQNNKEGSQGEVSFYDNLAGCEVEKIQKISTDKKGTNVFEHVYFIKIKTEVYGDTGGCQIRFLDNGALIDIIDYIYVTD